MSDKLKFRKKVGDRVVYEVRFPSFDFELACLSPSMFVVFARRLEGALSTTFQNETAGVLSLVSAVRDDFVNPST